MFAPSLHVALFQAVKGPRMYSPDPNPQEWESKGGPKADLVRSVFSNQLTDLAREMRVPEFTAKIAVGREGERVVAFSYRDKAGKAHDGVETFKQPEWVSSRLMKIDGETVFVLHRRSNDPAKGLQEQIGVVFLERRSANGSPEIMIRTLTEKEKVPHYTQPPTSNIRETINWMMGKAPR